MGNVTSLDELACRIDRLERQNRRLKHAVAAIALLAAGAVTMAQVAPAKAASIVGDRFTLVDVAERPRATLENSRGPLPASSPMLTFFDRDGNAVVRLGIGERGPTLEITDRQGKKHDYFGGPTLRPATQ